MERWQREIRERVIPVTESGCWLWDRCLMTNGYGRVQIKDAPAYSAHRLSWVAFHGPIPDGLFVCHRCDVKICVNPDHLFLGTNQDNTADSVRKGRRHQGEMPREWRRSISLGKYGHEVSLETRQKLSEKLRGRIISEETRKKMSVARTGLKHSPDRIARRAAVLKGKKRTEESKMKMRLAKIGKPWTDARRAAQKEQSCN